MKGEHSYDKKEQACHAPEDVLPQRGTGAGHGSPYVIQEATGNEDDHEEKNGIFDAVLALLLFGLLCQHALLGLSEPARTGFLLLVLSENLTVAEDGITVLIYVKEGSVPEDFNVHEQTASCNMDVNVLSYESRQLRIESTS